METRETVDRAGSDSGGSSSMVWWALAAGALIGGVAGVLLAPQAGAETRRQIRRYAEQQGDHLQAAGTQARQWLHEATASLAREREAKRESYGAEAAVREPEAVPAFNGR